jgi:16S rRNA (cytidine1402-2'-O)-methyltransferase
LRALDTLKEVDIILAEDTRQTLKILNKYEIIKKCISFNRHTEKEKLEYVKKLLDEGNNIALVSDAGMPRISDPGEDLVKACIETEIEIIPIPGSVACIQGLICSGFDTTKFVFEGFLSINKRCRKERLEFLKNETRTMLFYEAPHKLKRTLEDLKETFGEGYEVTMDHSIANGIHMTIQSEKKFTLNDAK